MPREFCSDAGAIQDSQGFLVGPLQFIVAHLASRFLNSGIYLLYEGVHFGIEFFVLITSGLVSSGHTMWAFLGWILFAGHTVYLTDLAATHHFTIVTSWVPLGRVP
jgi:hypothetical protein